MSNAADVSAAAHAGGMDRDINRLTSAAQKLSVRISPSRVDGTVTVSDADVQMLLGALSRNVSTVDANQARHLLTSRPEHGAALKLTDREANALALAFEQVSADADRAARIARGQYVGPMSGSEAVKFSLGRARRGF